MVGIRQMWEDVIKFGCELITYLFVVWAMRRVAGATYVCMLSFRCNCNDIGVTVCRHEQAEAMSSCISTTTWSTKPIHRRYLHTSTQSR